MLIIIAAWKRPTAAAARPSQRGAASRGRGLDM